MIADKPISAPIPFQVRKCLPEEFGGNPEEILCAMRVLISHGSDILPLPARGATAERWRLLAEVAAYDLSLAKIFESHADAIAILAEIGESANEEDLLAVWAAELPGSALLFNSSSGQLTGQKLWCSGASIVDEALITAKSTGGEHLLVRVKLQQTGVEIQESRWAAEGMAAAGTTSIHFDKAIATEVGGVNAYLDRPGFWHGGGGIAAVWYGGATAVAEKLHTAKQITSDPHAAAHLGSTYGHLQAARAALLTTALWIDDHPLKDAEIPVTALRAQVEYAAQETLLRTGRALGAVPLCTDRKHAQRVADLEIYLRQSHAERDMGRLGEMLAKKEISWLW